MLWLVRALLCLVAVCSVSSSPLRAAGVIPKDAIAPYGNLTSISTSSAVDAITTPSSLIAVYSTHQSQGQAQAHNESTLPALVTTFTSLHTGYGTPQPTGWTQANQSTWTNETVAPSCTVNIPNASIDWWFAAIYSYPLGRFTKLVGNFTDNQEYWSNVPNTATFDVTSALSDPAYTPSVTFDELWNETWTFLYDYSVTPTAASTVVVTRSGSAALPSNNIIPASDSLKYDFDIANLPPATRAIAAAPATSFIATSTTPVLYFSAYEVEIKLPVTGQDGRVTSTTSTETINLPSPYAYPFSADRIEDSATLTSTVPHEILQQIPHSSCGPGSLHAVVTVLVVVDLYYMFNRPLDPFLVHIESSAFGWDVPTTDPRVVVVNTGGPGRPTPSFGNPFIEHTVDGFEITSTGEVIKPADIGSPTPTTRTDGSHQGQGSLGQGPNAPEQTQHTVGTVGSAPVVIGPSSVVVVGSQTLKPGGSPITIGGTPVSLVPSATAIVVGGITSVLPPVLVPGTQPGAPPILTVGRSTLTPNAATQFFVAPGQTLTPGGTATVDGTIVSLAPSASFVVIGGTTQFLPTAGPAFTAPPEIIVGGSTFTANPGSSFIISGQTLTPGQEVTVDGSTVSLAPSASFVVVNGVTTTLISPPSHITAPPLTIGFGIYTAQPGDGTTYVIRGSTLTPGGIITVAGVTISLAPGATAIVVNGKTTLLSPPSPITSPPLLTIGSETYAAISGSGTTFVIGGQTLTPGGVITVDGTTISLAPGATELVYGSAGSSTTSALFPATTTRAQSITGTGSASAGASGAHSAPTATSTGGAAASMGSIGLESWVLSLVLGLMGVVLS